MTARELLDVNQAYEAMFRFLEMHFDRTHADEIGALLGSMALLSDGQPADPALWRDWITAVGVAKEGLNKPVWQARLTP